MPSALCGRTCGIDQYEVEVQTELVCILRTYIFHIQEQGMQGPFKID